MFSPTSSNQPSLTHTHDNRVSTANSQSNLLQPQTITGITSSEATVAPSPTILHAITLAGNAASQRLNNLYEVKGAIGAMFVKGAVSTAISRVPAVLLVIGLALLADRATQGPIFIGAPQNDRNEPDGMPLSIGLFTGMITACTAYMGSYYVNKFHCPTIPSALNNAIAAACGLATLTATASSGWSGSPAALALLSVLLRQTARAAANEMLRVTPPGVHRSLNLHKSLKAEGGTLTTYLAAIPYGVTHLFLNVWAVRQIDHYLRETYANDLPREMITLAFTQALFSTIVKGLQPAYEGIIKTLISGNAKVTESLPPSIDPTGNPTFSLEKMGVEASARTTFSIASNSLGLRVVPNSITALSPYKAGLFETFTHTRGLYQCMAHIAYRESRIENAAVQAARSLQQIAPQCHDSQNKVASGALTPKDVDTLVKQFTGWIDKLHVFDRDQNSKLEKLPPPRPPAENIARAIVNFLNPQERTLAEYVKSKIAFALERGNLTLPLIVHLQIEGIKQEMMEIRLALQNNTDGSQLSSLTRELAKKTDKVLEHLEHLKSLPGQPGLAARLRLIADYPADNDGWRPSIIDTISDLQRLYKELHALWGNEDARLHILEHQEEAGIPLSHNPLNVSVGDYKGKIQPLYDRLRAVVNGLALIQTNFRQSDSLDTPLENLRDTEHTLASAIDQYQHVYRLSAAEPAISSAVPHDEEQRHTVIEESQELVIEESRDPVIQGSRDAVVKRQPDTVVDIATEEGNGSLQERRTLLDETKEAFDRIGDCLEHMLKVTKECIEGLAFDNNSRSGILIPIDENEAMHIQMETIQSPENTGAINDDANVTNTSALVRSLNRFIFNDKSEGRHADFLLGLGINEARNLLIAANQMKTIADNSSMLTGHRTAASGSESMLAPQEENPFARVITDEARTISQYSGNPFDLYNSSKTFEKRITILEQALQSLTRTTAPNRASTSRTSES